MQMKPSGSRRARKSAFIPDPTGAEPAEHSAGKTERSGQVACDGVVVYALDARRPLVGAGKATTNNGVHEITITNTRRTEDASSAVDTKEIVGGDESDKTLAVWDDTESDTEAERMTISRILTERRALREERSIRRALRKLHLSRRPATDNGTSCCASMKESEV